MSNENTIECLERLQEENDELRANNKRLRQVLEANLLTECDGCGNWLIEEQIMEHPHHTLWGYVCYSCSTLRESDD